MVFAIASPSRNPRVFPALCISAGPKWGNISLVMVTDLKKATQTDSRGSKCNFEFSRRSVRVATRPENNVCNIQGRSCTDVAWIWGIIQTHHQRSPGYQTLSPSGRVQSAVWCCSPSPRWSSTSTSEGWGSCRGNPDSGSHRSSRTEPRCRDIALRRNQTSMC